MSLMGMCLFLQQAFNATAVVLHMRHLQLGNSQEAPSLSPLPSPCRRHLLLAEKEYTGQEAPNQTPSH